MPTRSWPSVVLALLATAAACGTADRGAPSAASDVTVAATAAPSATASSPTVASSALTSTLSTATATAAVEPSASEPTSAVPTSAADGAIDGSAATSAAATNAAAEAPLVLRLRLDRRVTDAATEGFEPFVEAVLTDERGWRQAGFRFEFSDTEYDYTVVLAEGDDVDELCLPYDTFGRFSCQIGPVVALNADRWRTAVDGWPASLDDYRTMLVNHEVGHLTGQHHPAVRCPGDGQPAPVMAQQSSGVAPCTANPWPLPWEIACAALRLEPIAPPFERDIELTCGPDGPVD